MRCSNCGGLVEWRGPMSNLTHTECTQCGGMNCQEIEEDVGSELELCRCGYCGHPCDEVGHCISVNSANIANINWDAVRLIEGECCRNKVSQNPQRQMVTREMAMDAGMPEIEGAWTNGCHLTPELRRAQYAAWEIHSGFPRRLQRFVMPLLSGDTNMSTCVFDAMDGILPAHFTAEEIANNLESAARELRDGGKSAVYLANGMTVHVDQDTQELWGEA